MEDVDLLGHDMGGMICDRAFGEQGMRVLFLALSVSCARKNLSYTGMCLAAGCLK